MALPPDVFDLVGEDAIVQGSDFTWFHQFYEDALPAPPFVANTPYVVGNYVTPSAGNETGFTYLCVVAGTPNAQPTWPTVMGGRVTASGGGTFMAVGSERLIDTDDYLARMTGREGNAQGAEVFLATTGNSRIFRGYDPPKWDDSTAYVLGDRVVPLTLNGWVYECVDAGTSDSSQPVWPTALGQAVTDGGVVWRCVMTDDGVTNLRVWMPASYTASLTNWGEGVYDLELIDPFGVPERQYEGAVWLSEEVTQV